MTHTTATQHSHTTTSLTETSPIASPRRSTPMLRELDREWNRLRRRPQTLRQVATWGDDPILAPHVGAIRDLDSLVAATQPGSSGQRASNAVLARLVARAGHDDLANRIVMQRLLPGLISASNRWERAPHSTQACDVAIGAAWLAIRHFDVDARRVDIAPALISDALWIGFRRRSRRKAQQEVPMNPDVIGVHSTSDHTIEPITALAAALRAAQRAGVATADLDVIRHLAIAGSPSQAARNCNVTVRTIRNRRDAAALRIRTALGPEWSDWNDPVCAA
ncbi:MAG: hypothetical protein AB8G14_17345 [Ilumatobacter sp.]